jgi:hypothetical protein
VLTAPHWNSKRLAKWHRASLQWRACGRWRVVGHRCAAVVRRMTGNVAEVAASGSAMEVALLGSPSLGLSCDGGKQADAIVFRSDRGAPGVDSWHPPAPDLASVRWTSVGRQAVEHARTVGRLGHALCATAEPDGEPVILDFSGESNWPDVPRFKFRARSVPGHAAALHRPRYQHRNGSFCEREASLELIAVTPNDRQVYRTSGRLPADDCLAQ